MFVGYTFWLLFSPHCCPPLHSALLCFTLLCFTVCTMLLQIPDTIQSVTLSRNGYNEAAMSGAIGSQVINLSLGVGMPLLVLCFNNPTHTVELSTESSNSLYILSSLLLMVIVCHNFVILPMHQLYNIMLMRFSSVGCNSATTSSNSSIVSSHSNNNNYTALVKAAHEANFSRAGAWCLLLSFFGAFLTFVIVNEQMT